MAAIGATTARQRRWELTAAKRDLMEAEKELKTVARATQALAERKMRRDSAGRRKASKGDAPRILLGAMKNRSEVTGANQAKLADKQKQMPENNWLLPRNASRFCSRYL